MSFVTITAPSVGDPTRKESFADPLIDNQNDLNSRLATVVQNVIQNGSFEEGSAANTAPSGWALVIASGLSTAFETSASNSRHGRQAFSMTSPGTYTGGVSLTSADFLKCAEGVAFELMWLMKVSVATTTNSVAVKWYDETESLLSTSTLYSANSGHPTSWSQFQYTCTPPAGAKLWKLVVTGVNSATAGVVYWDDFFTMPTPKYLRTVYTSGTGTHTFQKWATYTHVSGRGGGGGGGDRSGVPGNGGSTTLGSIFTARGGNVGTGPTSGTGGAGGTAQSGSYSSNLLKMGSRAGGNGGNATSTSGSAPGGRGSGSGFGAGGDGSASTGAGADGAGGGGAEGEEAIYKAAVTGGTALSYAVGSGGAAGTNSQAGTGGYLEIEEFG